jgi:hypothetical protein
MLVLEYQMVLEYVRTKWYVEYTCTVCINIRVPYYGIISYGTRVYH